MFPQILKTIPNWIWWRLENVDGKPTKVPYVAGSWTRKASSTDPSTWVSADIVGKDATWGNTHGIGFVLGGQAIEKKIVGFDLDGCRNKETGEITQWAKQIVSALNSYTEITPSQMGLRVWVQGELPDGARRFALNPSCGFGDKVGIEVYNSGRYFTVSGKPFHPSFVDIQSLDLTQAYKLCHKIRTKYPAAKMQGTSNHDGDSKVVFTQVGRLLTTKLSVLMYGQITSRSPFVVSDEYGNVQSPSQSEADLSLCTLLASQGLDADQIEDQFRASALMRKKWERQDYSTGTIQKALKTAEKQTVTKATEQQTQTEEDGALPFQIIGAELEPRGDVLFVFTTEDDAVLARSLGFNAVAVVSGEGTRAHLTMIKVKYEHVAVFGDEACRSLQEQINQGCIAVSFPQDSARKPKKYRTRKIYPQYTSLTAAKASGEYDDFDLQVYLNSIVNMQAVTSTHILHSPVEMRTKIQSVLEQAKTNLDKYEPKVVVSATMEDLRKLQFLDGSFPKPLTKVSLSGLLGDFVDIAYPTTAACKEMLLYEMLPMIGVMLGSAYYLPYGSDKHFPSLFTLAIGRTTDGKGQAMHHVKHIVETLDPVWAAESLRSNPASGEGLVRMLAQRGLKHGNMKNRVAIFNSEMSTAFNAQARENSTLSGHLRSAYDGDDIENFRSDKSKSYRASGYILGMCGLITPIELRKVMPNIDWTNGAANRFLWSIGFADKELPRSTKRPDFSGWIARAKALIDLNQKVMEPVAIDYTPEGQQAWDDWYYSLPKHNDDPLSESQQRAPANCARVANMYAQLDERRRDGWQVALESKHVLAAAELVSRSRQSVEWYLGQRVLTPDNSYDEVMKLKAKMLAQTRETGVSELTSTDVYKLFSHKTPEQRDELCLKAGFKTITRKPVGGGKSAVVWTE